jgi:peptidoglycan/LPS O-acetylase OafA/YrhL
VEAPRHPRYDSLDLWRGLACLMVVVFHCSNGYVVTDQLRKRMSESGGTFVEWIAACTADLWIGVPMFFVISGYCIAASADTARRKPHPAGRFFTRRFRRIYPPLWAFLGLAVLAILAIPQEHFPGTLLHPGKPIPMWHDVQPENVAGMLTLTEEWRPHLGGAPTLYPYGHVLGHLWTLCYEEQFYIVAGLMLLVSRRWFFPGVAVVTAVVVLNILMGYRLLGGYRSGVFYDGFWLVFALGIAVYYQINYATPVIDRCFSAGYAALFVLSFAAIPSWLDFHAAFVSNLAVGGGFAFLLAWLHRYDAFIAKLKELAPLRFCGRMCYSLYLVHAPIAAFNGWNCYRLGITDPVGLLLVTLPLGMGLSLLGGWLFHRLVEARFMNMAKAPEAGGRRPTAEVLQASDSKCSSQGFHPDPTAVDDREMARPIRTGRQGFHRPANHLVRK